MVVLNIKVIVNTVILWPNLFYNQCFTLVTTRISYLAFVEQYIMQKKNMITDTAE